MHHGYHFHTGHLGRYRIFFRIFKWFQTKKQSSFIFKISSYILVLLSTSTSGYFYIVGWIQPFFPFVRHPSTPALVLLILHLQELLTWSRGKGDKSGCQCCRQVSKSRVQVVFESKFVSPRMSPSRVEYESKSDSSVLDSKSDSLVIEFESKSESPRMSPSPSPKHQCLSTRWGMGAENR